MAIAPAATTAGFEVAIMLLGDGTAVLGVGSPARGQLVAWPIAPVIAWTLAAEAGVEIRAEPLLEIAAPGAPSIPPTNSAG